MDVYDGYVFITRALIDIDRSDSGSSSPIKVSKTQILATLMIMSDD